MLQPIDPGEFSSNHLIKIIRKLKTENLILKISLGGTLIILLVVMVNSRSNGSDKEQKKED